MELGTRRETAAAFWTLLLLLWAASGASSPEGASAFGTDFNYKAARVLMDEEANPKCFSQHLEDLACLWETPQAPRKEGENRTAYTFLYKFEDETTLKFCSLKVEGTARNTTRYTCLFQRGHIPAFTPIEVHVFEGHSANNTSLYSRKVWMNEVVFLDPPSNLTVRLIDALGQQLNVSWQAPVLAFLDTSILYEVKISLEGSQAQVVKIASGRTYCLVASLKGQTRYSLAVRAKPDGVSYNGYWSAWSQAVTVTTTSNVDPLILTLSIVLVLIVLLLAFITLMSHRRFLKKKIWPAIPTPEHEFKDLFTIYKGNFQLWLGHQSIYLGWSQSPHLLEEQPFLVEILSECDPCKVDSLPPTPLPPKTRGLAELPGPPDASQDEYLVLDEDLLPYSPGAGGSLLSMDGAIGESTGAAAGTREASHASSSFEYTVFDPSSESLSPTDRQAEPPLKSTYRMVSDSGISADYSPVGSNVGQASLYTNLCEGGIQPHPFLPAYIACS
ncbi:PREDICTED: erythropoietin receptor [Gekko japonicus]|uniref:Erythropoietin receptor n=1 Tax=Gekko japonicus TaxID=146911 RepID=A0ABM1KFJ2_GEKJA|nr:PREDICTED: erythropoietin receptor [Gekko japonicus]